MSPDFPAGEVPRESGGQKGRELKAEAV